MNRLTMIFLILTTLLIPLGCSPEAENDLIKESDSWEYADLRELRTPDAGIQGVQVIAFYSRWRGKDLQIRLDTLENPNLHPLEFDLGIQLYPHTSQTSPSTGLPTAPWDLTFSYPSLKINYSALIQNSKFESECGFTVQVDSDSEFITMDISCPTFLMPGANLTAAIFGNYSTEGKSQNLIGPIRLDSTPPSRAPLLLEFWNTYIVNTPTQALRGWNGAHAGPFGQRHGLYHLLKVIEKYQVPAALLDLKRPDSLAALEYIGQTEWVRHLENQGLLLLPETAYGDPRTSGKSLEISHRAALKQSLKASRFAFGPLEGTLIEDFLGVFSNISPNNHIVFAGGGKLIPLADLVYQPSDSRPAEIDRSGLTTTFKLSLLTAAISEDQGDLVFAGGSLPDILWAESSLTDKVFKYIAEHPWIYPLNESDLLSFPARSVDASELPACSDVLCSPSPGFILPFSSPYTSYPPDKDISHLIELSRQKLLRLPENSLTISAWQMYFDLTNPSESSEITTLQANYFSDLAHLLQAAEWAGTGNAEATCAKDIDWDGLPECILSSKDVFSSFEMGGGRIIVSAVRTHAGIVQWLGPTSQFSTGLSDAHDWKPELGSWADPQTSSGAFQTGSYDPDLYQFKILSDQLEFLKPDHTRQYSFQLLNNGLSIDIKTNEPFVAWMPFNNWF